MTELLISQQLNNGHCQTGSNDFSDMNIDILVISKNNNEQTNNEIEQFIRLIHSCCILFLFVKYF